MRQANHTRRLDLAMILSVLCVFPACEQQSVPRDTFDPEIMSSGDGLIAALRFYSGFWEEPTDTFFDRRHGQHAVYLYADGRVIRPVPQADPGPCRNYESFQLDINEFTQVANLITTSLAKSDGVFYKPCMVADAGSVDLYVNWRGVEVRTGASPCFHESDCCGLYGGGDGASAPSSVIAIANTLKMIGLRRGETWTSAEGGVATGCATTGYDYWCDDAGEVSDAALDKALFRKACDWSFGTQSLIPLDASELEATSVAMLPHIAANFSYPVAIYKLDGQCTMLACDQILPHEDEAN